MYRTMGIAAIIPISLLLTISYFILFTNMKTESGGLRVFGIAISILLWISAALILLAGLYVIATGNCPMGQCMHG